MTENNQKEIKTRQANWEELKKKHNDLKFCRKRLKCSLDRKQKLDTLSEALNYEGDDLKRSPVYLHFLPINF